MVRTTSEGMGYRFSETDRRISTVGASNIVTRLASRTVTGHDLPIHVHQHYALEFHFVLNPDNKSNGSVETCMSRRFSFPWDAQEVCLELETVLCQDSVRVFLTIDVSCLWQTKSNMFQSPTIRTRLMYL